MPVPGAHPDRLESCDENVLTPRLMDCLLLQDNILGSVDGKCEEFSTVSSCHLNPVDSTRNREILEFLDRKFKYKSLEESVNKLTLLLSQRE